MGWFYKFVFSSTGALAGGPWGTSIGSALGHVLKELWSPARSAIPSRDNTLPTTEAADNEVVLRSSFLSRFAAENGHFQQAERALIVELAFDQLPGRSQLEPAGLFQLLPQCAASNQMFQCAIEVGRTDLAWRNRLLHFACRVASKNGDVDDAEQRWILRANELMHGAAESVRSVLALYRREPEADSRLDAARQLLGIEPGASAPALQRRYRQLSLAYHPDRHVDVDQRLRELAAKHFAQVASAYALLSAHDDAVFGLAECCGGLLKAAAGEVIRCFGCRQRWRLPAPEHFDRVRCPNCQQLLLHRESMANVLLGGRTAG